MPNAFTNASSKKLKIPAHWKDVTPEKSGETLTIIGVPPRKRQADEEAHAQVTMRRPMQPAKPPPPPKDEPLDVAA